MHLNGDSVRRFLKISSPKQLAHGMRSTFGIGVLRMGKDRVLAEKSPNARFGSDVERALSA